MVKRICGYTPTILVIVFFLLGNSTITKNARGDEPLVLAMKIIPTGVHQEIMVSNGKEFRVLTTIRHSGTKHSSILLEGKVDSVKDQVVSLTYKVTVRSFNPKGSVSMGARNLKLNINEFISGGSGTRNLATSDIWIRKGVDPIPALIEQLSSKPKLAMIAASKLSEIGAGNKEVLAALKKAMKSENSELKQAAIDAVKKLSKN